MNPVMMNIYISEFILFYRNKIFVVYCSYYIMSKFNVRLAVKSDCSSIRSLILEYDTSHSDCQRTEISVENLEEDGFGDKSYFKCFIGEVPISYSENKMKAVGYALYYNIYSTWEGRSLKLEELYVSPNFANLNIDEALLEAVVKEGLKTGCSRIDCSTSADNQSQIEFLKKNGATNLTSTEDWHLYQLQKQAMENFIEKSSNK